MQFGEHHFRFRAVPTLLLALPIPLFVALGMWQLDRAEFKREQAQSIANREQAPPLRLSALRDDPDGLRYRAIEVEGRYEMSGQFFIENRRYGGKTGFYVICPLRQDGSDIRVLINRGWIAATADNSLPNAPVPEGNTLIRGVAEVPSLPAISLHSGPEAAKAWGKRWPYMTVELFAATVDYPVQPFVILQDDADTGGLVRDWPREMPKEGMHLGYAIQWFAFALIALIIYLKLSYAGTADTDPGQ